ncbi:DUF2589 domain-containing protein [Phascolarctobacterium sp.]
MAELSFKDLFTTIGQAIQDAQQAIELHSYNNYWQYFSSVTPTNDLPTEDIVQPTIKKILLPGSGSDGGKRELLVPVVALVNHAPMSLEEVKVKLKVKTVTPAANQLQLSLGALTAADEANTDTDKQDDANIIELTFKKAPPTEGIARITQEAVKIL